MNLPRLIVFQFLLLSFDVYCLPLPDEESGLLVNAKTLDVSGDDWEGVKTAAQTLVIMSSEAGGQELHLDAELETSKGRGQKKRLVSTRGESVLIDTSSLEDYILIEVTTETSGQGETAGKRMKLMFFEPQEAQSVNLSITSDKETLPAIVLTDDMNLMAKHWDSNPALDIRDLVPREPTAATTEPDEESGDLTGLFITVYGISVTGGQLMWFFGNLNYSARRADKKPLYELSLILQGLSYLAAFPFTPIQEAVGQLLYYCFTKKFAGLELFHFLSEGSDYPAMEGLQQPLTGQQ